MEPKQVGIETFIIVQKWEISTANPDLQLIFWALQIILLCHSMNAHQTYFWSK